MEINNFPIPGNLEDLKALLQQFQMFLPEEQRTVVWNMINEIEQSGGIRDEEHGKQLLGTLLSSLGMGM